MGVPENRSPLWFLPPSEGSVTNARRRTGLGNELPSEPQCAVATCLDRSKFKKQKEHAFLCQALQELMIVRRNRGSGLKLQKLLLNMVILQKTNQTGRIGCALLLGTVSGSTTHERQLLQKITCNNKLMNAAGRLREIGLSISQGNGAFAFEAWSKKMAASQGETQSASVHVAPNIILVIVCTAPA